MSSNIEKCQKAINELVKKHGLQAILECLLVRIDNQTINRIDPPASCNRYSAKLLTNLQRTLEDYKARYEDEE